MIVSEAVTHLGAEWVTPSQAGKSPEVVVIRMQLALMLDGEGGKMRVRGEAACNPRGIKEPPDQHQVLRSWIQHLNTGMPKPGLHTSQSRVGCQGFFQHTRMRHES